MNNNQIFCSDRIITEKQVNKEKLPINESVNLIILYNILIIFFSVINYS